MNVDEALYTQRFTQYTRAARFHPLIAAILAYEDATGTGINHSGKTLERIQQTKAQEQHDRHPPPRRRLHHHSNPTRGR